MKELWLTPKLNCGNREPACYVETGRRSRVGEAVLGQDRPEQVRSREPGVSAFPWCKSTTVDFKLPAAHQM